MRFSIATHQFSAGKTPILARFCLISAEVMDLKALGIAVYFRLMSGNAQTTEHTSSKGRKLKRMFLRIAFYIFIGYAALNLLAFAFQRSLVYFPSPINRSERIVVASGDEEVWIDVPDAEQIHGIYHMRDESELVVLFLHGNSGNVSDWREMFDRLSQCGVGVLMIDYPGYGKSEGRPCEETLYAAAHSGLRFLKDSGVEASDIVVFGKSLGAAVAVEAVSSGEFAGLILESPFESLPAVGRVHYWYLPVSLLLTDRYHVLSRIGDVQCPLLVVFGGHDSFVPPSQSLSVYAKANNPKELLEIEGADHNDIQSMGNHAYWDKLDSWLRNLKR